MRSVGLRRALHKAVGGLLLAIVKHQGALGPAQGGQLKAVGGLLFFAGLGAGTDRVIHAENILPLAVPGEGGHVGKQAFLGAMVRVNAPPVVADDDGGGFGVVLPPCLALHKAPFVASKKGLGRGVF